VKIFIEYDNYSWLNAWSKATQNRFCRSVKVAINMNKRNIPIIFFQPGRERFVKPAWV